VLNIGLLCEGKCTWLVLISPTSILDGAKWFHWGKRKIDIHEMQDYPNQGFILSVISFL
jgi:hypothetical protein